MTSSSPFLKGMKLYLQKTPIAKLPLAVNLRFYKNFLKLRRLAFQLSLEERIIRIPPFNDEIASAIRLICPHNLIKGNEDSREFIERDQNLTSISEYRILKKYLTDMPTPKKVLDVGAGLGRSSIFLAKKMGWTKTDFHLYDSTGKAAKYDLLGSRQVDTFCGNINLLGRILEYNKMTNARIFDAKSLGGRIDLLPGPYDLVFSFYAVGFHWALDYFLDEILRVMSPAGYAFFTIPDGFRDSPQLKNVWHEIVSGQVPYPSTTMSILVVRNLA